MSYTKICNLPLALDLDSLKGKKEKQYEGLSTGFLQYYQLNDTDFLNSFPMFSTIKPDNILIAEINGSGSIGPHIDHGPKCVLNWYVHSNNALTMFYKSKDNSVPFKAEGEDEAKLYNLNDLELYDLFTAKDNDVYLLDVTKIHAVSSPKHGNRLFLSLSWKDSSYEEVLASILKFNVNWNQLVNLKSSTP